MTTTTKSRDGTWHSADTFPLKGTRQLHLSTFRTERGLLVTSATVRKVENGFITWAIGSDFHERVLVRHPSRVTRSVCEAHHKEALHQIEDIKARALAFYAEKEAKAA